MKYIQVIHNTNAGVGKYGKEELIALLEGSGYNCAYFSTKSFKKAGVLKPAGLLVVAGGDGTVRKVVKVILKTQLLNRPNHIAILPLGTANNIAKTLGISGDDESIVQSWNKLKVNAFDVGRLINVPGEKFFLESFGYGIFPFLMTEMKKKKSMEDNPQKIKQSELNRLLELSRAYPAFKCSVTVDGNEYSGKYLLVEIMNTRSIGPNLLLAPDAEVGDGYFDVVLIEEDQREALVKFVAARMDNKKSDDHSFKIIKGKNVKIKCATRDIHADDSLLELPKDAEVEVKNKQGLLNFL